MVLIRSLILFLFAAMALSASIPSPDPRRAALLEQIGSLEQAGIRLHRTTDTPYTTRYVLQVVDENNATQNLLAGWGDGFIDPQSRAEIADWLHQGRLGLKIDWDRYLKHQARSIRVTFRGNAFTQKHPEFQKWLDGGHLGAWLSFGAGDRLTRATLIPVDARFSDANASIHWRVQGYDLTITRSHPTRRYDRATILAGGHFFLERTEANRTAQSVQIDHIACHTDTKRRFEGKADCQIPRVVLRDGNNRLGVKHIAVDQSTAENNGTVRSVAHGTIKGLDMAYQDGEEEGNMTLSDLSGKMDVTLGETIVYHTQTLLQTLHLRTQEKGGEDLTVEMKGLKQNVSVEDLYNFLPELTAMAQGKKPFTVDGNTTRDVRWYYEEILAHVIHHGATMMIDPLSIASMKVNGAGIQESFAPVQLTLRTRLDPNRIDVRRSSAPMLMLGFLHLDGKWMLAQKDFQTLLNALPTKVKMLLMVFVRYEKDQAVFDVTFDKGHLRINGKQVM